LSVSDVESVGVSESSLGSVVVVSVGFVSAGVGSVVPEVSLAGVSTLVVSVDSPNGIGKN